MYRSIFIRFGCREPGVLYRFCCYRKSGMKAVVLFSGGMDSATALYQANRDGAKEIAALTMFYGSKHQDAEMKAADKLIKHTNGRRNFPSAINHYHVELNESLFLGAGSALMGEQEIEHSEYEDYEAGQGPSNTVVPFRNGNLISAATAFAVSGGYDRVYTAVHASDHGQWAYPDCSPEFMGGMAAACYVGTLGAVRLVTPFIWMTKSEIVIRAASMEVPLELTWSCYEGGDVHCGTCPTCTERLQAFHAAGYEDPVAYLKRPGTNPEVQPWPTK